MRGESEARDTQPQPSRGGGCKPAQIIITTIAVFLVYLLFTGASGEEFLLWSWQELTVGIILSLLAGLFGSRFLFLDARDNRMANPLRILAFIFYMIGPFFVAMFKANLDVAYRVITGKINPGIVRIRPGLKSDLAVTLLANFITLTPGTLTVDIDEKTNDLFVHWINVDEEKVNRDANECDIKAICGSCSKWARRIAE